MPRNRRTVAPKKRPRVEDGPIEGNINTDDKNVKVDLLLRDFDKGVERRLKELEAAHRKLLRTMTRQYHIVRKNFTEDELNMKFIDYLEVLGKENDANPKLSSNSENEADISDQDEEDDEDEDNHKVMQTVHKKRGRRNVLGIISEDNAPATGTIRKRVLMSNAFMAPPPTATRSKFQTPAIGGYGRSRRGWETPMVTPKFDPRLPVTTARRPKRGESAITSVFMSGKGSPIHASQPLLTIPTANNPNQGVSFFGGDKIETVREAFESLDPQMKENMRKLADMMKMLTDQ